MRQEKYSERLKEDTQGKLEIAKYQRSSQKSPTERSTRISRSRKMCILLIRCYLVQLVISSSSALEEPSGLQLFSGFFFPFNRGGQQSSLAEAAAAFKAVSVTCICYKAH